jgi:hypothetical protein
MRIDDLEQDLKVIRKAIELSSRYTNITARGYFFTGVAAAIGTWWTYAFLGRDKIVNINLITPPDVTMLTIIWSLVFVSALGIVAFFSWRKARKNQISAWNSLSARMLFSQIPLIAVAGILTFALAYRGHYAIIPGMWLSLYGVVLYAISYYTGIGQKIEGSLFMVFGSVAVFAPGIVSIILLGAGFGGIHIASGLIRWGIRKKGCHESERVK